MAINTTPNLHLPQWTPDEKPSYLVDFNGAFKSIDDGFAGITTEVDNANQTASDAMAEASSATSEAQAALQTANQAQYYYDTLDRALTPVSQNIDITPTSSATMSAGTITFNAACANIYIAIILAAGSHGPDEQYAVMTLPSNITFQSTRVLIPSGRVTSGWVAYFSIENINNNTYSVKLNHPIDAPDENIMIIGTMCFPAHYVTTNTGKSVLRIATL